MHSVNLDLLRALPHHPDGRPKNPHAHHLAAHVAMRRAARAAAWRVRIARLRSLVTLRRAPGLVTDRAL